MATYRDWRRTTVSIEAVGDVLQWHRLGLTRTAVGGPGHGCHRQPACCERGGEYDGFQTGPRTFDCPARCMCHD